MIAKFRERFEREMRDAFDANQGNVNYGAEIGVLMSMALESFDAAAAKNRHKIPTYRSICNDAYNPLSDRLQADGNKEIFNVLNVLWDYTETLPKSELEGMVEATQEIRPSFDPDELVLPPGKRK